MTDVAGSAGVERFKQATREKLRGVRCPDHNQPPRLHFSGASLGDIRISMSGCCDKLMTLAGELVLARNQLLQFTAARSDPAFLGTAQRLDLITTELQAGILKVRMQPIGTLWGKLPRLARDLARACGKQVEIDLGGADTELDKAILEALKGPLTHLVRNAIDHGIEPA